MRLLFVVAHPLQESLTLAAHRHAITAAKSAGHEVQEIDLYADGFQPCLQDDELKSYTDPDATDDSLLPHVEALQWAEGLILCYPTWWSGPPAILKGWIDRVWRPGIAFHLRDNGLQPGFGNIRFLAVFTTLGASWTQYNIRLGAPGRKQILRALRICINPAPKTLWLAHYTIDASTAASRGAYLRKIATYIAQIAV